ncbi:MAG: PSD1 domain-containing protein [Planctomycetes bacterium]|nr:PSD1 domain-containing protein [Planctomycetota bacterium]
MSQVARGSLRQIIAVLLAGMLGTAAAQEPNEAVDYFERQVRPILVENCQGCHGVEKQESDLRLDSREAMLQGGVSGPVIVAGDAEKSLLVAAIRREGDIRMPPKGTLTDSQIAIIANWVKLGAPWPAVDSRQPGSQRATDTHWAFQPIGEPRVPTAQGNRSPNPIDAFIRAKLADRQLSGSPRADRRSLIRRASFDLLGLPPTPEEVVAFERDDDPLAYEKLIERLLARPQYGEHWGRHWLDVARYSDTKGYVYAREQRFWVHAWVYRDWVVRALNDDLPYDRFLVLQIAADQAAPEDREARAALGFLTLGRRFLGVQRDIIDDRIDVVTRGTMGLTVGCARCHDHKYDPIPTRDYYSLYGVFQSCAEHVVPIAEPLATSAEHVEYVAELEKRRQALADGLAEKRRQTAARNRARVGDYLAAQFELHKYPVEGFDQILAPTDLIPNFVRRWQEYLAKAEERSDPIFTVWHAYAGLPNKEFAAKSAQVTQELAARPAGEVHPLVARAFASPPATRADVAIWYGKLFADIDEQWLDLLLSAADAGQPLPTRLPDPGAESLRQLLYDTDGPCEVPDEPIVNIEYFVDSASCTALWKLQSELDNHLLRSPPEIKYAIILTDRDPPARPRVFRRGNPANPGEVVPRQFLELLAGADRQPFTSGSGRLELAQAIVAPDNPLSARVIVNRVWMHHFGAGLVRTPSDFGTRAEPPSHPELLDWLARRLIEDGWSLKRLHRRIMTSQTYQQSSRAVDARAVAVDPENRLLWRMNPRRLSFEEMRDALLAATGHLDLSIGGRAGDLFSPSFTRRTLYGLIDRQFLPATLRTFDFANPDLHMPLRAETTVPQQALFFLNHPLMIAHAQSLARATAAATSREERVQQLFQRAYQRSATPQEVRAALELVELAHQDSPSAAPVTATAWQYGYGRYDEQSQRVAGFTKLPHFTGSAWQGGPAWPDMELGWVQLTAEGGHPGNDRAHAAIRRWTASSRMRINVRSTLVHEPAEGQGVRGFVVSNRHGLLKQATVHHGQAELNAGPLEVESGDTIDFVVDIGPKLSHNQFLWRATTTKADEPSDLEFDSKRDFDSRPVDGLTPWEQLAQALLSANELIFID